MKYWIFSSFAEFGPIDFHQIRVVLGFQEMKIEKTRFWISKFIHSEIEAFLNLQRF